MKFLVLISLFVVAALADDIDWSNVKVASELFAERPSSISNDRVGRIVGGLEASRNQFPYQVTVLAQFPTGGSLCGGSIIGPRIVITAAHCVDNAANGTIILGGWDRTNVNEVGQTRQSVLRTDIVFHEVR